MNCLEHSICTYISDFRFRWSGQMESQIRSKFAQIGTTDTCIKAKFLINFCLDSSIYCANLRKFTADLQFHLTLPSEPEIVRNVIPNKQSILISGSDGRVKWNRKLAQQILASIQKFLINFCLDASI